MKTFQKAGDSLIQTIAHKVITNQGIKWNEIFGSVDNFVNLLDAFHITTEDVPNILQHFEDVDPHADYELTDLEARYICRNFIGDPDLEEQVPIISCGDASKDEIFFKIFSDYLECNNYLHRTIEEFVTAKPWGVWQVQSTFYALAPNETLKAAGLNRQEYVKKCVLDIYNKPMGRRRYKCVEAPKPISIF